MVVSYCLLINKCDFPVLSARFSDVVGNGAFVPRQNRLNSTTPRKWSRISLASSRTVGEAGVSGLINNSIVSLTEGFSPTADGWCSDGNFCKQDREKSTLIMNVYWWKNMQEVIEGISQLRVACAVDWCKKVDTFGWKKIKSISWVLHATGHFCTRPCNYFIVFWPTSNTYQTPFHCLPHMRYQDKKVDLPTFTLENKKVAWNLGFWKYHLPGNMVLYHQRSGMFVVGTYGVNRYSSLSLPIGYLVVLHGRHLNKWIRKYEAEERFWVR